MTRLIFVLLTLLSTSVFAQNIQLRNLSKEEVEIVSKEISVNFVHTTVSAPETDEGWGLEFGVMGSGSNSPEFSKQVKESGGDGEKVKYGANAGLIARVHIPLNLFVEASLLPEQEVDNKTISSSSFGVGWNVGRSIGLPFDIAFAYESGNGDVNFKQKASGTNPAVDVSLMAKTTSYWVGISKNLWILTPYVKIGSTKIDRDIESTTSIYNYTASAEESISSSGGLFTAGVNLEFGLFKIGGEVSKIQEIDRYAGKFSLDF